MNYDTNCSHCWWWKGKRVQRPRDRRQVEVLSVKWIGKYFHKRSTQTSNPIWTRIRINAVCLRLLGMLRRFVHLDLLICESEVQAEAIFFTLMTRYNTNTYMLIYMYARMNNHFRGRLVVKSEIFICEEINVLLYKYIHIFHQQKTFRCCFCCWFCPHFSIFIVIIIAVGAADIYNHKICYKIQVASSHVR